jgi:NAD(P)-dependent dehydrogenase (short-subunit alcohol dehydrogenase family)
MFLPLARRPPTYLTFLTFPKLRLLSTALLPFIQAEFRRKIPLDRFGTPEEVADAAVFLAANEYANNCVLNLDGGLSAT